jgi:histidyl-tRNA synthetase
MPSGALPGFRDFYPAEFAERAHLFDVWRDVARRFGFVEYDGPPLESLELYTKKSGEEIVAQLYAFKDKGDRDVALRPEMTPTLARMVGARANALRKPVRWFSIPQLFRYERQQRGRLREHFQLNMDILGEPDVTADAELLAAAIEIMRSLGLTSADVQARVSDRRLLNALLRGHNVADAELPVVYAALDKVGREPDTAFFERLAKAGIDHSRAVRIRRLAGSGGDTSGLEKELAEVGEASAFEPMRRYLTMLSALGVRDWVRVDLSVVRGLAYYTGIVFELFDAQGEFRAICGGGRYDNLLEQVGGSPMPALGFGMGDVVLTELLRDRKKMPAASSPLEYWVAYGDDVDVTEAMGVAAQLRAAGTSVEYALGGQKLARQLKAANAAGARSAVIIAKADLAQGDATIKNLSDGSEQKVKLDKWIASQRSRSL